MLQGWKGWAVVGRKFWILTVAMLMGFLVFGIFFQMMFNTRSQQNNTAASSQRE